jgi:hypothetical protein
MLLHMIKAARPIDLARNLLGRYLINQPMNNSPIGFADGNISDRNVIYLAGIMGLTTSSWVKIGLVEDKGETAVMFKPFRHFGFKLCLVSIPII